MDVLSQDNQRAMGEAVLFLSSFCPSLLYVLEMSLPDCWGDAKHKLSIMGETALKLFNLFSFLEYIPEWVVSHLGITLQALTSQHWHPKGLTLQKKIQFSTGVANLMQIWRTSGEVVKAFCTDSRAAIAFLFCFVLLIVDGLFYHLLSFLFFTSCISHLNFYCTFPIVPRASHYLSRYYTPCNS